MSPAIELVPAGDAARLDEARALFREYQKFIGVDLCFQGFEQELASLPGDYAPPSGRLYLAKVDAKLAGCIALRPLSEGICEMKRLYVRPEFHGQGLARRLATTLLEDARQIGYARMRLDTLPTMTSARALYDSLGFKPIAPYDQTPLGETLYFERALHTQG